jgi:nitrate/nitrite transport system ATP-binding protein
MAYALHNRRNYAARNHIIDFLVTRSRSYDDAAKARLDRRHAPVVRPALAAPAPAAAE